MKSKLKALAILPVAVSLTFFGLQAVSSSFAETTGVGTTPATTGATAVTIEDCEWYLDGVTDELSLINTSGMEYVGDDYTLSAEDAAVDVYFSGTATKDERCSFYDDVVGAGVDVSWTGSSFVGDTDSSLDWDLGDALETSGTSVLSINYTKDVCDDAFSAGTSADIDGLASPPVTPASISDADVASFNPSAALGSATFAKCSLNANYSVVLPGGRTPSSPGASYSFTGPALSTTITVNRP